MKKSILAFLLICVTVSFILFETDHFFKIKRLRHAERYLTTSSSNEEVVWHYNGEFHELIKLADRIVFYEGGSCNETIEDQEIFFELHNVDEITQFNDQLQFVEEQSSGFCMCCGYPGINWYKGKELIAQTSLHHGRSIRWKGFPGDAELSDKSSLWLAIFLLEHNLSDLNNEFREIVEGKRMQ